MTVPKYTRPEMSRIWSDENKYACWLRVEIAAAEAWAEQGRVPVDALPAIRRATFDLERISQIEEDTQHDVIAFLRNLSETVGPDARWIHLGLTSSDIVDTGLALQLVESVDLLLEGAEQLARSLARRAIEHRKTVMMGRTHNVHAEPITFGHKLAVWYAEMQRHIERLTLVRREISIAKIAGAVGTHANVPPAVEERVADILNLIPEIAATQVVQRDRHATYVLELALLASSLDKVATELRNLQHTEILEVEEPFGSRQQGSSAMPHKRNPILNERVSGLARVVRGYAVPALENVVLWHERDISNSSVERVVLPDSSILTDYMLHLLSRIVDNMVVRQDQMAENMTESLGLYFSEKVLLALVERGLSRPDAYTLVQRAAMQTRATRTSFQEIVKQDPTIRAHLAASDIDGLFDLSPFLRYVDATFERCGLAVNSAQRG